MSSTTATHAKPAPAFSRYLLVWVALLILTVVTYSVAHMHRGPFSLIVAMFIACTKATLVGLFFMHLWDEKGLNRLILLIAALFLGLMLLLDVSDVRTRFAPALPPSVEVPIPER
jgi:cytochrome c oxidase subunit IV